MDEYGVHPSVTISHIRTPKDQTSDLVVYTRSNKDSGAIHLMGRGPCVFRLNKEVIRSVSVITVRSRTSDFLS